MDDVLLGRKALAFLDELSPESPSGVARVVVVFGRYSPDLAETIARWVKQLHPNHLVLSGGVGKDSGPLAKLGMSESHYLMAAVDVLTNGMLRREKVGVHCDLTATNGVENALRTAEILVDLGYAKEAKDPVAVVAHSTQMARLGLTFRAAADQYKLKFPVIDWIPSSYKPDPERLDDLREILFEIKKLGELVAGGVFAEPDGLDVLLRECLDALGRVDLQLGTTWCSPSPTTAWLPSA